MLQLWKHCLSLLYAWIKEYLNHISQREMVTYIGKLEYKNRYFQYINLFQVKIHSNLTKFFIKVWCVNQGSFINFFIIKVLIPWNEERAQEFLHFYRDIHGYRYDKVEQNHKWQEVSEHLQNLKQKKEFALIRYTVLANKYKIKNQVTFLFISILKALLLL